MLFPFHMGVHTPFRDNHYQWIISIVKYCTFVLHVLLTGISNAHKEDVWPGQWIAEDNWPSSNVLLQELTLHEDRRLAPESEGREKNVLNESETKVIIKTSFLSGSWCGLPLAFSLEELPVDQRLEDAGRQQRLKSLSQWWDFLRFIYNWVVIDPVLWWLRDCAMCSRMASPPSSQEVQSTSCPLKFNTQLILSNFLPYQAIHIWMVVLVPSSSIGC